MFNISSQKRKLSEFVCDTECKISKMSPMQLTAFAREIFEKSNLDNMSRKALVGILRGEKSAQGIQKAHIEDIVRFLLKH